MPDTGISVRPAPEDISREAVRILRDHTGRGPTKARTIIAEGTVAIVLGDTLTKGERTLVEMGEQEHVLQTRRNFQQTMRADLVRLVERQCGRTVEAFFSANHIDPDYAVEYFLLKPGPDDDESTLQRNAAGSMG
jgi:uncharacterized protein YbcI